MVVYRLAYMLVEFVITGLVFNKIDTVHDTAMEGGIVRNVAAI